MLLLLVWVGPVTFVQTGSWELLRWVGAPERASGEPRVIPAGMTLEIAVGTALRLHMRDGSIVEGRFLGRALLDSALYASRFAAQAQSSAHVPFALGETLHVSLRDGRQWSAPFAGYAELALLLRSPDEPDYRRVPFESAREIRRANGDPVEPAALAREFQAGSLPSAEALVLAARGPMRAVPAGWPETRVAVEDIQWASVDLPPVGSAAARSGGGGADVAGIVVLSVVLSVVLVFVIIDQGIKSAGNSCRAYPAGSNYRALAGVQLTTRPFDRDRGCFLDDPLAVADPWPGATVGSTAALDNVVPSPAGHVQPVVNQTIGGLRGSIVGIVHEDVRLEDPARELGPQLQHPRCADMPGGACRVPGHRDVGARVQHSDCPGDSVCAEELRVRAIGFGW
jgi:hypothetical protein